MLSGRANFSYYVSLQNALRRLRARRVTSLPVAPYLLSRGTHLGGLSFCHANGSCQHEITILRNRFGVMTYQGTLI